MSGTRIQPGAPLPSLPPRADTAPPRSYHQIERAQPRAEPHQHLTAWKKRRWGWTLVLLLAAAAATGIVVLKVGMSADDGAAPTETTLPAQFKDALRDAQGYLDVTPFSRAGLERQLTFEQYPADAVAWAMDHLDVSWRDQAARAASSFLEFDDLGEDGLRRQLALDGFTADEIDDAVAQMKVQGLM